MQRAEDTRGLIVLIRSPNTLYIYILYIYIHTVYIYILYIYILYIYILYIHTVPHLYIQPYDGMARSFQWHEAFNGTKRSTSLEASNDDLAFAGSMPSLDL